MTDGPRFSPVQRIQVRRSAALAEDLTGRFYCIPGREWPRFPVEVRTLADGAVPDAEAFAEITRLVPERPSRGLRELYRIVLRDDRILAAVGDRRDGITLEPLLLYVLTHEFVHVVRFGSGVAPFEAADGQREAEEDRVHAITRRILEPARDPALGRVIETYRDAFFEEPDVPSSK